MFFLSGPCNTSSILKVIYFIFEIINIAFIIVPIGLIIMVMLDFAKNVISKEDEMKKNLNLAIKRIIMCIAVFLVPTIVSFLVGIVENADDSIDIPYSDCISNATLERIEYYVGEEDALKQQEEAEREEALKQKLQEENKSNSSSSGTIVSADSDDNNSDNNDNNSVSEEQVANGNVQDFLDSLENMSNVIEKAAKNGSPWKYDGSMRANFAAAKKSGKTLDCAVYVSYALIDIGVLKEKAHFWKAWKNNKNKIEYRGTNSESRMKKKLKYIDGDGKTAKELVSEGKLKKGDIVLWNNVQHTNVYAGDKKWYDAGRWSANGAKKSGNKFKTLGPIKIDSLWDNWKIWKILRVKAS